MALGDGTFTTMKKILPGTYINFVSAPRASAALLDRGIAAMPAEFDWGPEGAVFAVESGEFEKRSLELFGYPYTHEKLKGLRDLFRNIRKGYFYRLNTGGEPAKNDFATALHPGTRGNSLRIVIEAAEASTEETPVYDVSTWMDDTRIDLQTVKTAAQLHDNAFVRFQAEATLAATAGANLTGGRMAQQATRRIRRFWIRSSRIRSTRSDACRTSLRSKRCLQRLQNVCATNQA